MAFFAESTVQESYQDLGIVVNDYTDFDMLALEACDVIEEMNNAILYGIGHYELDMIREGAEVVYTEGMLDSIKDKITDIGITLRIGLLMYGISSLHILNPIYVVIKNSYKSMINS